MKAFRRNALFSEVNIMSDLKNLLAQKAAIEKQIEEAARRDRSDAIARVKSLMAEHGLSIADLSARGAATAARKGGSKVAAKYRDTATGNSWSGRGLRPNWLKAAIAAGRKLEDFTV
jgi:DNA-binding protein H-NS